MHGQRAERSPQQPLPLFRAQPQVLGEGARDILQGATRAWSAYTHPGVTHSSKRELIGLLCNPLTTMTVQKGNLTKRNVEGLTRESWASGLQHTHGAAHQVYLLDRLQQPAVLRI